MENLRNYLREHQNFFLVHIDGQLAEIVRTYRTPQAAKNGLKCLVGDFAIYSAPTLARKFPNQFYL